MRCNDLGDWQSVSMVGNGVCVCVCVYSGLELTTDVAIWFTIGYSLIGTLAIAFALGMG
jgi:hypothetical protein